ncbi:3(2),5-bisphosphate nucleotidase HAL2 [Jaminaea rosea]|uniref:3'(2'),5'-bisphosphate nucleotidase n=1 Tax=Jaminaea rosea TaxID=1569628 RepID=A0A316UYY9_9BASI|nr:3(2),5-bisphosphate nucleotidase HAL2 [Jaminaea rosea]PWN29133.1 3(2),5-bisphosphate nucleotidase HAL2 [Jaminaea rosea]
MSHPPASVELSTAISAVSRASLATSSVFRSIPSSLTKEDKSPVTLGDFAAQAVVNSVLHAHFSQDKIVAEEEASALKENGELRGKVTALVKEALQRDEAGLTGQKDFKPQWTEKAASDEAVMESIDLGSYSGGSSGRFWTLDPIDGTKGFLRGGQYAVCLALVESGKPTLAVMACPNLPFTKDVPKPQEGDRSGVDGGGSLFVAVKGGGAWQRSLNLSAASASFQPISMRPRDASLTFCESVEAGHSSQGTNAEIAKLLTITAPPVRMDSQAKYASVARGDGDVYLRLPTGKGEYQEKIWDHASGQLLCEEAGGKVTDCSGKDLDFGQGRTLKLNKGVVVAHRDAHEEVLKAVQEALEKEGRGYLARGEPAPAL